MRERISKELTDHRALWAVGVLSLVVAAAGAVVTSVKNDWRNDDEWYNVEKMEADEITFAAAATILLGTAAIRGYRALPANVSCSNPCRGFFTAANKTPPLDDTNNPLMGTAEELESDQANSVKIISSDNMDLASENMILGWLPIQEDQSETVSGFDAVMGDSRFLLVAAKDAESGQWFQVTGNDKFEVTAAGKEALLKNGELISQLQEKLAEKLAPPVVPVIAN